MRLAHCGFPAGGIKTPWPLGSPHWATGAIIETLEQELGINIVQGSQSILWWALRSLGINDRIEGYGKLLREH